MYQQLKITMYIYKFQLNHNYESQHNKHKNILLLSITIIISL